MDCIQVVVIYLKVKCLIHGLAHIHVDLTCPKLRALLSVAQDYPMIGSCEQAHL